MKKWKILNKIKNHPFGKLRTKIKNTNQIENIINLLLRNRGIKTKKEIEEFLNPKLEKVTIKSVGIDQNELKKAIIRIKNAIKKEEQIIIFGDYDVDGICGAAILWETLNELGAKVLPYIPHRIDEGYGISLRSIVNIKNKISRPKDDRPLAENVKLIITVDNGIVANEAVEFAYKNGIDVIITDHHVPGKKVPKAYSIVHTTKLCGAGVAWMLSKEFQLSVLGSRLSDKGQSVFSSSVPTDRQQINQILKTENGKPITEDSHLELVALATIADLVPLTGANRTLTKFGLEKLSETQRLGLLELFKESGLDKKTIGTYEVGHVIAPRLNAMGRLESAMDSLRLLCTRNKDRAKLLSQTLSSTNSERQKTTEQALRHAQGKLIQINADRSDLKSLIFIAHESYQQGVIGLVASKLVEEYYVPSIVVSKGEKLSRASARSISGFNIIEFIRSASEFLVDAGGHPMAAGFTVETAKLELLQKKLSELAQKQITKKLLSRVLRVDCELPLNLISFDLYNEIQNLSPFGMGNPVPTFLSKNLIIENMRVVGNDGKHLKLEVRSEKLEVRIEGIAFNMGNRASEFHIGDKVDLVYTIDQDLWNGNRRLQLKIKDIKVI